MRRVILTLVLLLAATRAFAQTGANIDTPTAASTTSLTPWIGGWAIDANGSGVGIDAVQVWLFPQPYGDAEFLGGATIGDDRPDIATVFGSRFEYAGWHLQVSTPLHAGASLICAYGRNNVSYTYTVESCVDLTVYMHDPSYPDLSIAAISNITSANYNATTNTLTASGFAVRDASQVSAGIGVQLTVDDYPGYGYAWATLGSTTGACTAYDFWVCEAVTSTSSTATGATATYALPFTPSSGWHYMRFWLIPSGGHVPYSNAWWFYVN